MIALPDEHTDALITMLAARNGQLISTLHALRLDLHDLIDGGTECSGDDTRISLAIRRIEDALSPAPASSVGDVHVHSTQSPSSAGGGHLHNNGMCWEDADDDMVKMEGGGTITFFRDPDGAYEGLRGYSGPTSRPRTAWKLAWLLLGVIALLGLIGLVF